MAALMYDQQAENDYGLGGMGAGMGMPAGGGDDWFSQNAPPAQASQPGGPAPQAGIQANNPMQWDEGAFTSRFGSPKTPQELMALEQQLNQSGIKVLRNAAGVAGKIQLPTGQIVDVINSAGIGGKGFQWLTGDGGAGGLGSFGSLAQGWDKEFKAPSIDEIRAMPGYQFARDEGVHALDSAAAARGTVNSGGQKKAIMNFATGLADQFAQQKYQNALGEYQQAYNIFRNNGNDTFDRYDRLASRGTSAAGAATA
ncbi:MAG TPA: hypothetical protein PKZ07_16065 [Sedimentisphaerales bacterium]|mgnify:CR=1 FL=1|nr:hypothetical protein [Sedimentisphaerales bacterium]